MSEIRSAGWEFLIDFLHQGWERVGGEFGGRNKTTVVENIVVSPQAYSQCELDVGKDVRNFQSGVFRFGKKLFFAPGKFVKSGKKAFFCPLADKDFILIIMNKIDEAGFFFFAAFFAPGNVFQIFKASGPAEVLPGAE